MDEQKLDPRLEQLDDLIDYESEIVKTTKGEEHKKAVENLKILCDARDHLMKTEYEHDEKYKQRLMDHDHWETEQNFKESQQNVDVDSKNVEYGIRMKQNKQQNLIGWSTVGVTALVGILGIALDYAVSKAVMITEQTGTVTSIIGKNKISKINRRNN